ncbi:zinc metalloproteinase nas-6-like [Hetaerina americana]|uniref:zinc metalloproteinase nas-6-like n=1 Tax=Hetaerina americana TaxID=62018 RepID=UPI003A7F37DD
MCFIRESGGCCCIDLPPRVRVPIPVVNKLFKIHWYPDPYLGCREESASGGTLYAVRQLGYETICAAPVGYYGIKTDMFLSAHGCRSWGTIQHEFLHALGFWHEHTRPDRDSHVQIMWQNIRPGRTGNFLARSPIESQYEGMPYDYGSVMHYRAAAFSRDGSPTIVPLQAGAQIGQRVRYSMIDLAKLNRLYGCGDGYYLAKGLYEGGEEVETEKKEPGKEEKEEEVETEEKKGEVAEDKEGGEVSEVEVAIETEGEEKRGEGVKDSISEGGVREMTEEKTSSVQY